MKMTCNDRTVFVEMNADRAIERYLDFIDFARSQADVVLLTNAVARVTLNNTSSTYRLLPA